MTKELAMRNPEALERENTELKRVVEELRKAKEKLTARLTESSADLDLANDQMLQLAAIVESSEDAIGCTLSGFVTIWNRGAERLFGYTAEDVIGQPTSTNSRLNWPDVLRAMNKVRSGEHVPPFETVRRHKAGKKIHVSVSVSTSWEKTNVINRFRPQMLCDLRFVFRPDRRVGRWRWRELCESVF